MLHPGLKLGERYRLDSRIGAGGMGEVWQAFDEVLGRVVAVKAMLPEVADEPDFARRFQIEAKSMASVNHPAVASIHDYGRSNGITFLVMEFIDGESLAQVLRRAGRLSPAETMRLIAQAADGLQAVHDRGIVHRDIKPANLLIRRNGALLITDFGISRTQDGTHLTVSGAILGTPTYLSPEQVLGQPATALSDVYSLGLTAYECLAGRRPFGGDNPYAVALQRLQVAPATLTGNAPGPVLEVIERSLAVEPAHRWPSAAALADAARRAAPTGWAAPAAPLSGLASAPSHPSAPSQPSVQGSAPPAYPSSAPSMSSRSGSAPQAPPAPPPSAVPTPGSTTSARRWSMIAAVLGILLVAGGIAAWKIRDPGDTGVAGGPATGASQPGTTPSAAAVQQAGLAACGKALCPTEPMCWDGLLAEIGKAKPPVPLDCARTHAWEVFSAVYLPADAVGVRQDELLQLADVKAACSASVMASRSSDRSRTKGWWRDAWPVQVPGTDVSILYCIARPESGERSGTAFKTS